MNQVSTVSQNVSRMHILLGGQPTDAMSLEARTLRRHIVEAMLSPALWTGYLKAAKARFRQLDEVSEEQLEEVLVSPRLNFAGLVLVSKMLSEDLTYDLCGYHAEDIALDWEEAKKGV